MSLDGVGSGFLNATEAPDTLINSTMDWIMNKMDQFPIKMSFLFACSMVIGSVVPYIPQYFTIKQSQNTEGFSLYVCLTLLVANILRIMFWFGKRFETALLVQSIVMIFAMFALLELCVRVRNSNLIIQGRRHYFAGADGTGTEKSGDTGGGGGGDDPAKMKKKSSLLVNGATLVDDNDHHHQKERSSLGHPDQQQHQQMLAVSNSTVSSTVIEHIVIPNPHSILTQLPNAVSKTTTTTHSARSQSQVANSTKPINHSSTGSLSNSNSCHSSSTSSCSSPSQEKKQHGSQQQHNTQNHAKITSSTDPLCAATLSHSSSSPSERCHLPNTTASEHRPKQNFDMRYFWEWTDFISYLECMAIFAFFTGLVMFFFINQPLVVESYGFVALVTESLLASPQFYRNFKSKSTEGMSRMMVFTWFLGDLYKTIYFVTREAPAQFLLCGFTQITFDCAIFLQILWYKKANYRMLSKSRAAAVAKCAPASSASPPEEVAMNKLD